MTEPLFYLDSDSDLSLQQQIRQKLVSSISTGVLPPGAKLPSSRKLAEQLGVARNTVVAALQQLSDEGFLVSKQRSGLYVCDHRQAKPIGADYVATNRSKLRKHWKGKQITNLGGGDYFRIPPDWHQHPYPFLDGVFDNTLFPVNEWREANKQALAVRDVIEWSGYNGDADDPLLVEEIRTKILPKRGVIASADEILITIGIEQGQNICCQLLAKQQQTVAIEEPGNPFMRQIIQQTGAGIRYQPIDHQGLVVDERLNKIDLLYCSPSHQIPTSVTMPVSRRKELLEKAEQHDFIIIEDDIDCESNFLESPHPALYSMDEQQRVIYLSCLSQVLTPGLRLGFLVAPAEIVKAARRLRRSMVNHPPRNNQRAMAYFISLGHYDAYSRQIHAIFKERWNALRDALNHYLHDAIVTAPSHGGTSYWIEGPEHLNINTLVGEASKRGILIEPVDHYFASKGPAKNCFRLGVSSIPVDKIRSGIEALSGLIKSLSDANTETLQTTTGHILSADELQQTLSGAVIFLNTVYNDPCTIELHADGLMIGRAGFANEDCDQGRWWIEGDFWHRQWQQWAYGEALALRTVIDGEQIKWFRLDGKFVDSAIIKVKKPMNLD
ncbi:GntR family transcriptional regulator/MocR family aminotransferase [Sinobacterium caligoides]|uniref:GntR family transcriptional regulator/MocR family aminotransferase n=1 Tax=Sinobacterium caligoides TaxID=933926 RepID=A0A3N2DJJ7_9GAMM|nr:PLP-dependent aminotransferase family protein [Sinobacterium caligoides]ROR99947.1 GntR family transcriptional regulator/MocR family aminotransferase [Sinobacterium caligoides]